MGNPFKNADPNAEAVWAVITTDTLRGGRVVSQVEWCLTEGTAEEVGEHAVSEAMEGEYAIQVFIVELKRKCFIDKDGKVEL